MPLFGIILILGVFAYKIYVSNYKKIRNYKYKKQIEKSGKELYRDIDNKYSPSIVSYLYNQKIEPEKDLIADILNLYAKKIIDIIKTQDERYEIVLNKDTYKEIYDKNELLENDKYIIRTIILKQEKFVYSNWINVIVETYRKIGLAKKRVEISKEEQDRKLLKYIVAFIVVAVICMLASLILENTFIGTIGFMIALIGITVLTLSQMLFNAKQIGEFKDMHLSDFGKTELKKWIGLSNYIKSYTLLEIRNMEEIILFEQYIPFAMVLDINKKYVDELLKVLGEKQIVDIWKTIEKHEKINNIFAELI